MGPDFLILHDMVFYQLNNTTVLNFKYQKPNIKMTYQNQKFIRVQISLKNAPMLFIGDLIFKRCHCEENSNEAISYLRRDCHASFGRSQ